MSKAAVKEEGGSGVESWCGFTMEEIAKQLETVPIRKLFPKYGYFDGDIVGFNTQTNKFRVVYEDEDEETMELAELAKYLPSATAVLAKEFLRSAVGGGSGSPAKAGGPGKRLRKLDKEEELKQASSDEVDSDVEFVPDKPKAPEVVTISDSESEWESEGTPPADSEESEWEDQGSSTKGQAKIKVGKVTIEAFCIDVDEDQHGDQGVKQEAGDNENAGHVQGGEEGAASADIRAKIRKMLKLGLHPDTPDAEAQQALKQANRFLTRYNLQQVDILPQGSEEDEEQGSLAGGMKVVKLRSKTAGRTTNAAWISRLGGVVSDCFDCCTYTTHTREGISYVFYGVATNAECAGYAFAAAFNRVSLMTANFCGEGTSKRGGAAGNGSWRAGGYGLGGYWGKGADTTVMRANYRDGLVQGLSNAVRDEKAARKRQAKEREERRRACMEAKREAKLAKARAEAAALADQDEDAPLISLVVPKKEEEKKEVSDGEDEMLDDDGFSDGEDQMEDEMGWKWRVKAERQHHQTSESQALVVLEQHCQKVAEQVLKKSKVKLRAGRPLQGTSCFDSQAFNKGKEDAKQIDIKQRGLDNKPAAKRRRG